MQSLEREVQRLTWKNTSSLSILRFVVTAPQRPSRVSQGRRIPATMPLIFFCFFRDRSAPFPSARPRSSWRRGHTPFPSPLCKASTAPFCRRHPPECPPGSAYQCIQAERYTIFPSSLSMAKMGDQKNLSTKVASKFFYTFQRKRWNRFRALMDEPIAQVA